ncbi:MAG: response regulator transcription factor [Chloroflexi bacterium]|nr:response regulator transcription factor [Chloroflexota bacterium]
MQNVRILVVDDQTLMRQGIASLLHGRPGLSVVGEACNGSEAVRRVEELHPDVVLMNARMPVMDGVCATRQICQRHPRTRVVLLTTAPDEASIAEGVAAGACGFLLKDVSTEDLIRAVHTARAGEAPLDPRVARHILGEYSRISQGDTPRKLLDVGLTRREIEILRGVVKGWGNKRIGTECSIKEKTVKTHLRNIFRKLQINDRTQAAVYMVTRGLH